MKQMLLGVTLLACLVFTTIPAGAASYSITALGNLPYPNNGGSFGLSINSGGQVTGYSSQQANGLPQAFFDDGSMHALGTLPGGSSSTGYGINASGQITGDSPLGFVDRAFLYDGTMHDLGTLSGDNTSIGLGINASGKVTGWSADNVFVGAGVATENTHAFLYDGTMHDLGTLGGSFSQGHAINDSGAVTGVATLPGDTVEHAFVYSGGSMHDLGTVPNGIGSAGLAISANGKVAGTVTLPTGTSHAFLYDGTMHDLGSLVANLGSGGYGVNDSGQVVGESGVVVNGSSVQHAFVYDITHGMVDLNTLIDPSSGWRVLTRATSINDAGQITGWGDTLLGGTQAFILTPIPEPGSLVLSATGTLLLAGFAARRKYVAVRRSRLVAR